MPKAKEVAAELRKLADAMDTNPEAEIAKPFMSFSHTFIEEPKQAFMTIARMFPKPLKKTYTERELEIEHDNKFACIYARIDRSKVCEIVEPAKPAVYRCEPILSAEEDAELEAHSAE